MSNKRKVYYVTPTQLSFLDLTTIGGSEKRGDETKIGQFCSGLKYALAILTRNNVKFSVIVSGSSLGDRDYSTYFEIGKEAIEDKSTGKGYEVLTITRSFAYESFHSQHTIDEYQGDDELNEIEGIPVRTAISTSFGEDWELWQAMREIHSNMIDEGGYISLEQPVQKYGDVMTTICLEFEEGSEFEEVFDNRDKYFLSNPDLDFIVSDELSIGDNPEDHLKIYKQGILVYEDKEVQTPFIYNVHWGTLDERRILHDPYSFKHNILSKIYHSKNKELLEFLLTDDFHCDFLTNSFYANSGAEIVTLANRLNEEGRLRKSLDMLLLTIKEDLSCTLSGRKERGKESWRGRSYNPVVTIELDKEEITSKIELQEAVDHIELFKEKYNIEIPFPVIKGKLRGSTSVFDPQSGAFIITEEFNSETLSHVKQLIVDILNSQSSKDSSSLDILLDKYIEMICKK